MNTASLLTRKPYPAPSSSQLKCLDGATVLVTGGGGSIGSELCVHIAKSSKASRLLIADISECALYQIERKLSGSKLEVMPLLVDVRHEHAVRNMFWEHRPDVVLHAAALKHVPMLQKSHNAIEAVRTNVLGTARVMAEAGRCPSVKTVMLVSTDKAVNPTSWMGVTKRCAEKIVFARAARTPHVQHLIVRFGNVLGSSGSVVPLFHEQIEKGGPVTLTHPDMTRFMMTIEEAVGLMLSAVDLGSRQSENFGLFVLDMGEPIRIDDLADRVMAAAGKIVQKEVIGMRPGEKLFEELFYAHEKPVPSKRPGILRASAFLSTAQIDSRLTELVAAVDVRNLNRVFAGVQELVPEINVEEVLCCK